MTAGFPSVWLPDSLLGVHRHPRRVPDARVPTQESAVVPGRRRPHRTAAPLKTGASVECTGVGLGGQRCRTNVGAAHGRVGWRWGTPERVRQFHGFRSGEGLALREPTRAGGGPPVITEVPSLSPPHRRARRGLALR